MILTHKQLPQARRWSRCLRPSVSGVRVDRNGDVGIVEDTYTSSGGWVTVSRFCKQTCFVLVCCWRFRMRMNEICDPHWLQHDLFADRQVVFVRTSGNHTFEECPKIAEPCVRIFSECPSAMGIHINHTQFWIYERVYFWNHGMMNITTPNLNVLCFLLFLFCSGLFCVMYTRVQNGPNFEWYVFFILTSVCVTANFTSVDPVPKLRL